MILTRVTCDNVLVTLDTYLQAMTGKAQVRVRPSYTVKGMEVASKKSDKARLKMKMFLAVLITFLLKTAHITSRFPNTAYDICLTFSRRILGST